MTEKQIAIVDSALKLFSTHGFNAVSTSRVASDAGVSEGLIFRHFQNKNGLLKAVISLAEEKMENVLVPIRDLNDSSEVIQRLLELPFHLDPSDHALWKLMYSLKWQEEHYDSGLDKPVLELLISAFEDLNYLNPETEAYLILSYMDGFAMTVLVKSDEVNTTELLDTLRRKYISK